MKCPSCGANILPGDKFCRYCGNEAPAAQAPIVVNIYNNPQPEPIRPEQRVAPARQAAPAYREKQPAGLERSRFSRLCAVLLCLFFGIWGVHRFYVRKIGTGLLYLFTFGFLGIGVFADLVMLLFGVFTDKDGYRL